MIRELKLVIAVIAVTLYAAQVFHVWEVEARTSYPPEFINIRHTGKVFVPDDGDYYFELVDRPGLTSVHIWSPNGRLTEISGTVTGERGKEVLDYMDFCAKVWCQQFVDFYDTHPSPRNRAIVDAVLNARPYIRAHKALKPSANKNDASPP